MPKKKTKEEFISNSRLIHTDDKYDYSKVEYTGNKIKVELSCKYHGTFFQTPNDHIGGHGCRKCSEENQLNYNLKEAYSEANKDFNLDLYVVELFNEKETFLKIGISKNVDQRFKNIQVKSRSKLNPILVLPTTLKEATLLEDKILKNLRKDYKKYFDKKFSGSSECLKIESKENILNEIKEFYNNKSPIVSQIIDYEYNN